MGLFNHGLDHAVRGGLKKIGIKSKTVHKAFKYALNPYKAFWNSHKGLTLRHPLRDADPSKLLKQFNSAVQRLADKQLGKQNSASSVSGAKKANALDYRLDYKYRRLSDLTSKGTR